MNNSFYRFWISCTKKEDCSICDFRILKSHKRAAESQFLQVAYREECLK